MISEGTIIDIPSIYTFRTSIDADLLAHDVYEPGSQSLKDIVAAFGDDILSSDATIDRKKLGAIVFSNGNAMSVSLLMFL